MELVTRPVRYVSHRTNAHFRCLWQGFDPFIILDDLSQASQLDQQWWRHQNRRFRLPVVIQAIAVYNLLFERAYYGTWSPPEEAHEFTRIMTRFWPGTLQQRDIIFSGPYLIGASYFFNLYVETWPQSKWFMYTTKGQPEVVISAGGKRLPGRLVESLYAFRARLMPRYALLDLSVFVDLHLAISLVYYVGELFFPSGKSDLLFLLIFAVLIPVFFNYTAVILGYGNRFWLNLRYLHLKQRYYADLISRLTIRLVKRRVARVTIVQYFNQIGGVVSLMREIRDYNRFWSRYASTTMTLYSMEVCYVTFITVTASTLIETLKLLPLTVFAVTYSIYIYMISQNCSRIIINSKTIHQQIRRFNVRAEDVSTYERLKMEGFDCYQRFFQKSAFRTVNNYTIDFRMFEMLAFWILFFSMKLFLRTLVKFF